MQLFSSLHIVVEIRRNIFATILIFVYNFGLTLLPSFTATLTVHLLGGNREGIEYIFLAYTLLPYLLAKMSGSENSLVLFIPFIEGIKKLT